MQYDFLVPTRRVGTMFRRAALRILMKLTSCLKHIRERIGDEKTSNFLICTLLSWISWRGAPKMHSHAARGNEIKEG
jgi:hypothetical protein